MRQASCAVLAVALAGEPVVRKGLVDSGRHCWPNLRGNMEQVLPDIDYQRLQPMLKQVWRYSCRA